MKRAEASRNAQQDSATRLARSVAKARSDGNEADVRHYEIQLQDARNKVQAEENQLDMLTRRWEQVRELKAPRSGLVIASPIRSEVGKLFDRGVSETAPLF